MVNHKDHFYLRVNFSDDHAEDDIDDIKNIIESAISDYNPDKPITVKKVWYTVSTEHHP
jgi:hypothetical protein